MQLASRIHFELSNNSKNKTFILQFFINMEILFSQVLNIAAQNATTKWNKMRTLHLFHWHF